MLLSEWRNKWITHRDYLHSITTEASSVSPYCPILQIDWLLFPPDRVSIRKNHLHILVQAFLFVNHVVRYNRVLMLNKHLWLWVNYVASLNIWKIKVTVLYLEAWKRHQVQSMYQIIHYYLFTFHVPPCSCFKKYHSLGGKKKKNYEIHFALNGANIENIPRGNLYLRNFILSFANLISEKFGKGSDMQPWV